MFKFLRSLFVKSEPEIPVLDLRKKKPNARKTGRLSDRETVIEIMRHRRRGYGVHVSHKLSRAWRREAAAMWAEGKSVSEIMDIFAVSRSAAEKVVKAEKEKRKKIRESFVDGSVSPEKKIHRQKIMRAMQDRPTGHGLNPSRVMTKAWRAEAREMYYEGMSLTDISHAFRVSVPAVRLALGRTAKKQKAAA